jgi:uncharacterized damage-inducible protein DinB
VLFEYNRWANQRVLNQASLVNEAEYFAEAPGLSFGSLHATLAHILVAEVVWLARWQGGLPPEELKDARRSDELARTELPDLAGVQWLWQDELVKQESFFRYLTDEQVSRPLRYQTQYGEANVQPLEQLIAHFINHGTQFRSEAAVRLTQLGRSTGDLDLIVFLRQR